MFYRRALFVHLVDYMATYKHSRTILVYPIMQNTQHAIVIDIQQVFFFFLT